MFTPKPMQKINIFMREEDVEQLVAALAQLEVVDLSDIEAGRWRESEDEVWADLAETYTDQEERSRKLLELLAISRREISPAEQLDPRRDAAALAETLQEAEDAIQAWRRGRQETEEEIERLELLLREMELLEPLDVSMDQIRRPAYLHLSVGTIPQKSLRNLQVVLYRIPFVIIPCYEYETRVLVVAATDRQHAPVLDRALRSIFMEPLELPEDLEGAPGAVIDALKENLAEAKEQLAELDEKQARLFSQWRERLLALWHQARYNARLTRMISQLGRHGDIYLLSGWIPKSAQDQVTVTVAKVTDGRADIEMVEPVPGDRFRVPTLLRNVPFLRPFETIVSTYGYPGYDEIDPTPLVGLTFVLMFGVMFGDVGHGLLLALAAYGLSRRAGQLGAIGAVLLASAISSIGFGFLYGSLFGREDILPHVWLSPLNSMADILLAAVLAGIVVLNIGFILHLLVAWRSGAWGHLLFDPNGLAGIWLYWALLGGAFALWQGYSIPPVVSLLALLLPAGLIFLHRPLSQLLAGEGLVPAGGWGEYSVEAFFELFETIISKISNSISFVRLGAFAVAHAGLSQIVLALAGLAGGVGWWLVMVVGTVIIVAFEGLIVGIQALRLEYYEFFGKFFTGRGRPFVPLRLSEVD